MVDGSDFHPRGLSLLSDIGEARWIEEEVGKEFARVGSLIPGGFEEYVRLFHPARDGHGTRVRWADIARWAGRVVHPMMAFERVSVPRSQGTPGPAPWASEPTRGSLDADDAQALAALLAGFTPSVERCYFAIWEGYGRFWPGAKATLRARTARISGVVGRRLGSRAGIGQVLPPPEMQKAPRLRAVERNYFVYTGPLSAVPSFFEGVWSEGPNLWWPADKAWCVATDIDLDSTFVGGSGDCISALRADPRLEALPITLDAPTYADADTVNAG